jgi:hypothetical protein
MENKEKFEDIFRGRFSQGMDLPVDQPNWENIKDMLAADRKKRKRRIIFIIFFIGLLSGISVMIPLISTKNRSDLKTENKTQEPIITETTIKIIAENKTIEKQKEEPASVTKEERKIEKQPEEKNIPEGPNEEVKIKSAGETQNVNHVKENKDVKQVAVAPVLVPEKTKQVKHESKEGKTATVSSAPEKSTTITPVVTKQSEKNSVAPGVKPTTASEPKEPAKPVVVAELKKSPTAKAENATKENAPNAVSENTAVKNATMENATKENISNPVAVQIDTTKTLSNPSVVVAALDTAKKKTDSAVVTKNAAPQQLETPLPPRKNIFSILAGTGYAMGWHYGDTTEGRGLNPLVGIGYTRTINKKWSVQTGVQATSVGYLTASSHLIKHYNNDFGYNSTDSVISTTRLYYLTIPLQLQFAINSKNQIGVGGTFSYLINGSGKINTYSQSDDKGITDRKEISQTGYVKGFNTMNAIVMLVYTRRFSNRFSGSLVPYYGLTDIKNNSFFSKQKFEREMGVKLILSFNIFK